MACRGAHIGFIITALALMVATLLYFGWGDGCAIVASLAVAVALPWAVARRRSWWGHSCSVALGVVSLLMVGSAACYMWSVTLACGATLEMPHLTSDSSVYYQWALHYYDGRCPEPRTTFFGFPMAMLALWRVFGVSVVWPVAMNVMLTLLTMVMAGDLAARFTRKCNIKPSTAATITIALMALHGYFLSQGFVILKEALVYLAITLVAMVFARLVQDHSRRNAITCVALYTLACIILALVRAKYINFVALGVALLAVSHWRKGWRSTIALMVITVAAWFMGMYCSKTYTVAQQVGNVVGGEYITLSLGADEGIQAAYLQALGGYFSLAVWKKILLLPVTCGTQFLIPLFWLTESSQWTSIMPRISLGWYLSGGLALCYFAMLSWRRNTSLGLTAWWPIVCCIAIAYITGGTINRYILPFQPLFASIATHTIAVYKHDTTLRHPLRIAFALYLILLTTALVTANILTT